MKFAFHSFLFRALHLAVCSRAYRAKQHFLYFSFFIISTVNKIGSGSFNRYDREESCETSIGTNRFAIPFPLVGAVDRVRRSSYRSSCCRRNRCSRYRAKGYSVDRWVQSVISLGTFPRRSYTISSFLAISLRSRLDNCSIFPSSR